MAVKNEPRNRIPATPQGINQRLDRWLDHSAPGWFRYLARLEWHKKADTRTEAILNYGAIILITIALVIYVFATTGMAQSIQSMT